MLESLTLALAAPDATPPDFTIGNLWILLCAMLVFVMHLGFATLESGLTRAKNATNILFKNTMIVAIGLLSYAAIGFGLMYPGTFNVIPGVLGLAGVGIGTDADGVTPAYTAHYTYWADFLFQGMFAATAATIVSGAVAERIRLAPFLVFSAVYVTAIYPLIGSWQWGGGWLKGIGFADFAGSTLVHSVGGWGALAGALVLGPRFGKYLWGDGGRQVIKPIVGHSMPLATIGAFLLWFGWFGFNGGSVLSAEPGAIARVLVVTTLAAAAGIVGAAATSWIIQRKPDLTMILNGCLAGLVGITAGADALLPGPAVVVGAIAGVIVVLSVIGLDRVRIDDPVGAVSVHLVCGVWGTLAVALFGKAPLLAQLAGIGVTAAVCFPVAFGAFWLLRISPLGLRVSREEEIEGLDVGEHAMEAYGGFQIFHVR